MNSMPTWEGGKDKINKMESINSDYVEREKIRMGTEKKK